MKPSNAPAKGCTQNTPNLPAFWVQVHSKVCAHLVSNKNAARKCPIFSGGSLATWESSSQPNIHHQTKPLKKANKLAHHPSTAMRLAHPPCSTLLRHTTHPPCPSDCPDVVERLRELTWGFAWLRRWPLRNVAPKKLGRYHAPRRDGKSCALVFFFTHWNCKVH